MDRPTQAEQSADADEQSAEGVEAVSIILREAVELARPDDLAFLEFQIPHLAQRIVSRLRQLRREAGFMTISLSAIRRQITTIEAMPPQVREHAARFLQAAIDGLSESLADPNHWRPTAELQAEPHMRSSEAPYPQS